MSKLLQILSHYLETDKEGKSNQYLQIYLKDVLHSHLLGFLYNHRHYKNLDFYGGTCLRICYGLNRMSEDLVFDNSELGTKPEELYQDIDAFLQSSLQSKNHSYHIQTSENNISRIILKFPVLYELGLSTLQNHQLHVRIDLSNHAQHVDIIKTPIFRHGQSFILNHFDESTLMAGKMIAAIERTYSRGSGLTLKARDYYDLLWLMQKGVQPDKVKLATDGKESYTLAAAFELINIRIEKISPKMLLADLEPLFENTMFIRNWVEIFSETFKRYQNNYLKND